MQLDVGGGTQAMMGACMHVTVSRFKTFIHVDLMAFLHVARLATDSPSDDARMMVRIRIA
jgi:hypothetical protein